MAAMSTRMYLLRHGQVDASWQGRVYGGLDVPLSEAGREEALRAAREVPEAPAPACVISSTLERARYGARAIAEQRGLPHHVDEGLCEIDRGDWAGQTRDELEAHSPGAWRAWHEAPGSRRPPGGENLADLTARVVPRLDHWAAQAAGAAIAVVAHLWVVRVAVAHALELPLDGATRLALPTARMVTIDWPGATEEGVRPTLAGFGGADPPVGSGWYRGPKR